MVAYSIAAVVVTYNPKDIRPLLARLKSQCDYCVVVDNASDNSEGVRFACEQESADFVPLNENVGIAAAQNTGISWARERGASHVLLMDHDSLPAPDMVALLFEELEKNSALGAVGPLAAEEREGGDQLVYVARRWKPGRARSEELEKKQVEVAFLIASGCLIRMDVLSDVGLMNEVLFIDHVDLEWGLRARNAGWKLAVIPAARLYHELGDEVVILPGRSQPIHVHSPIRNYYLARNTVWLFQSKGLAPALWRIRYVWWLAKYAAFNALMPDTTDSVARVSLSPQRVRMLAEGLRDGFRGRMGRHR